MKASLDQTGRLVLSRSGRRSVASLQNLQADIDPRFVKVGTDGSLTLNLDTLKTYTALTRNSPSDGIHSG